MTNMRLAWVDKTKGVGMLLVILGHMRYPYSDVIAKFIFSFHMPLFFFLSGYLHKNDFGKNYFLRRVDALLVPYFIWSILIWVVNLNWGRQYMGEFIDIPLGNGYGITWFLSCLFLADIASAFVVRKFGKRAVPILVVGVCCASLGVVVGYCNAICVVARLNAVLLAIGFWIAGWLFQKYKLFESYNAHAKWAVPVMLSVGVMYLVNSKVDMRTGNLGNPFLAYPVALAWIMLLVFVVRRIGISMSFLNFIGCNSLLFMVIHWILPTIIIAVFGAFGLDIVSIGAVAKTGVRIFTLALLFALVSVVQKNSLLSGRYRLFSERQKSQS